MLPPCQVTPPRATWPTRGLGQRHVHCTLTRVFCVTPGGAGEAKSGGSAGMMTHNGAVSFGKNPPRSPAGGSSKWTRGKGQAHCHRPPWARAGLIGSCSSSPGSDRDGQEVRAGVRQAGFISRGWRRSPARRAGPSRPFPLGTLAQGGQSWARAWPFRPPIPTLCSADPQRPSGGPPA